MKAMKAKQPNFQKHPTKEKRELQESIEKTKLPPEPIEKEGVKFQRRLDALIKGRDPYKITEFVAEASESIPSFSKVSFYRKAFDFLSTFPAWKVGVHVESVGQSTAIAYIKDRQLYLDMVDFLLDPRETRSGRKLVSLERVTSACRILASISVSNEKVEGSDKIDVPEVFELAMDRLLESEIQGERRIEEKADRLVEVFEQALAAGVNPDTSRELYDNVFHFVMDNELLSKDYKLRTLMEITRKAIKTPGLSHTELFVKTQEYFRANGAATDARTVIQLLRANKK